MSDARPAPLDATGSSAADSSPERGRARQAFDWTFRSRATGRITIGQLPNLSLGIFLVATALRVLLDPQGDVRTVLSVVGTAALVWWAIDEIVRGVNPWRRFLGAVVLGLQVIGLLLR